jgi:hypothetical protein
MQRNAERLEQRCGAARDRVRDRVYQALRPGELRPKPTVGHTVACELHLSAEMAVPCPAGRTAPAGHRWIDHDALAAPPTARHRAGELVTEDEGPLEHRVADTPLEEPMPVRSAETDTADRYEHLARPRLRIGLLMQAKLTGRVQPQCPHAG